MSGASTDQGEKGKKKRVLSYRRGGRVYNRSFKRNAEVQDKESEKKESGEIRRKERKNSSPSSGCGGKRSIEKKGESASSGWMERLRLPRKKGAESCRGKKKKELPSKIARAVGAFIAKEPTRFEEEKKRKNFHYQSSAFLPAREREKKKRPAGGENRDMEKGPVATARLPKQRRTDNVCGHEKKKGQLRPSPNRRKKWKGGEPQEQGVP